MERKSSVAIFTLGCKVNQYESQRIARGILREGLLLSPEGEICILNACAVTARADRKTRQIIYQARKGGKMLIVTGCIAPPLLERIRKEMPDVMVVPPDKKEEIPHLLRDIMKPSLPGESARSPSLTLAQQVRLAVGRTRAFVAIQNGCDGFCNYCIVPYMRGKPRSRPPEEVKEEIKELLHYGFKEIVLCGIRLGKYGVDLKGHSLLPSLIEEIASWEGDFRIRLSSLEPMDVGEELLQACLAEKVCPHFHLPLQSGSDKVLKRMGRKYTVGFYLDLIGEIKNLLPSVAITTDIIVGFPGETEEDFEKTIKVCEEVGFAKIHVFPFSPRPGTAAEKWDDVRMEEKKRRAEILRSLGEKLSFSFRRQLVNGRVWVLFQGKKGSLWEGLSHNYIKVYSKEAPSKDLHWCYVEGIYKEGLKVKPEEGGIENGKVCILHDSGRQGKC